MTRKYKKREATPEIFQLVIQRTKKGKFSAIQSPELMFGRFSRYGESPDLPIVIRRNGERYSRGIHNIKENQPPEFGKIRPISKTYVFTIFEELF